VKGLLKCLGEVPEARWGAQLIRIAQDMIIVCDDKLDIQYHNQSFVKKLGYSSGSYHGRSLLEFFPSAHRDAADSAFEKLRVGSTRGLEVEANFLTRTRPVAFVAEVTRSLRPDGGYYFYMIARPAQKAPERAKTRKMQPASVDPSLQVAADMLERLPIAAWRTDERNCVTQIFGKLWDDLSVDRDATVGVDLSVADMTEGPEIFRLVKPSARAGSHSFVADVAFDGRRYSVTVEPLTGDGGKRQGSIGFICAARTPPRAGIESGPVTGTRTTTILVNPDTRKVATIASTGSNGRQGNADIEPRALTPPTRLTPIVETMKRQPLPLPKRPTGDVALPG